MKTDSQAQGSCAYAEEPEVTMLPEDRIRRVRSCRLSLEGGSSLVPGLSRITWVFYTSARRLLRECIIDDTSSYQALHLHFHILRRLQHALASVSLSRLARAHLRTTVCLCIVDLVYILERGRKQCIVNRALLKSP